MLPPPFFIKKCAETSNKKSIDLTRNDVLKLLLRYLVVKITILELRIKHTYILFLSSKWNE